VALGNPPMAETMFRRVLEIKTGDPDAANQIASYALTRGEAARRGTGFSGRSRRSAIINNLGILYMEMGQPNDAIAAFLNGIEVAPEDESLYLNVGRIYATTGNPDKRET